MGSKRVPEVRFKGFSGEWEEKKLRELASFAKGNGYSKSDLIEEGEPIILYGRLYTKYQTVIEEVDTFTKMKEKSIISKGYEVIVPSSGETSEDISRASVVKRSGVILGGDLNVIYPSDEINSIFLALTISNGNQQKELRKKAQGKSVVHLHNSELKEVNLYYPKKEEQSRIGNFFKQLDETIAIQQQELDTLKQTKQGFLQKMFPKEGESVPEIRFPGFGGEWEGYNLGKIVEVTMGQSPKGENYTKNPHDNILVQGNADIKNGWVVPRLWTTQITKVANKGDIILSVRAPVGDVGKTQYDVVIGRGVAAIKGNEFIYQLLLKMKVDDFWKKFSTGSTFESINSTDIKEAMIRVPNELEQNKIGDFLKRLDETIALHEHELDILKQTKKAFLQKMFV
ncbi:restriction endonuclease subunit S [Bacillus pumilus]|uniref:restriction endonuclease subunit S n=1 Tax=Bacillus pumilus TaxID=1408 RepID=UPI00119E3E4D|nr:restriction endonuclease subunit S [Bacillus pumilus]